MTLLKNEKIEKQEISKSKTSSKVKPNGDKIIPGIFDGLFKALIQSNEFRKCLYIIIVTCTHFTMSEVIDKIRFLNTELKKEKYKEKGKITDILIDISGHTINIEANTSDTKSLRLKNHNYHHKISTERFSMGSEFDDKYVYQLSFESIRKFDDRIYLTFTLKDEESKYSDEENFKRVYICIAKAAEKYYNNIKLSKFEKILVMLQSTSRKELFGLAEGDEDLMAMAKKIDDLNTDENIIGLYDEEKMKQAMYNFDIKEATAKGKKEGLVAGKTEGIAIGKEQGSNEKAIAIAKNMIKKNLDIDLISDVTGLSKQEIEKLQA